MSETGIVSAEILIPNVKDFSAWACVACDQFTGDESYWQKLYDSVGDKPSALNLILPEIYLGKGEKERIERINDNMQKYLKEGLFKTLPKGFVLTVRETPFVKRRVGIIGAVDLEKYEYTKNSSSLVRATEGTIEGRIPPRLAVRKNAELEFPHIMILFDDEKREIAETLYNRREEFEKLYDFPLNMGGGKVAGWFIPESFGLEKAFSALAEESRLTKKYGDADKFIFAVGDGNHSLATAKAHWEEVKKTLSEEGKKNHPARFALAEFNNIYDEGIYFEPIYRFVSGINREKFIAKISGVKGRFGITDGADLTVKGAGEGLPESVAAADGFIKEYIAKNGGAVDYIHGEENLFSLVKADKNSVGITFDKLKKEELFGYVAKNGSLPRKTFSMGEGVEKRYYLEGKRIR